LNFYPKWFKIILNAAVDLDFFRAAGHIKEDFVTTKSGARLPGKSKPKTIDEEELFVREDKKR